MQRRHTLKIFAAGPLAMATSAWAQAPYPQRPVRLVVGFSAGGSTDVAARKLAQRLSSSLGQQVVVENKLGAAGSIASAEVARSAADGYTLQMATSGTHTINPTTMAKIGYDPVADFIPIGLICTQPLAICVNPSVPARSLPELFKLIKDSPGKYAYASSGNGGIAHVAAELLRDQAGLNMVHIPYKGGAPATQDVIAGHVPILFDTFSADLPHHRAGRLRILAVTGETRSRAAPELATVKEHGLPNYVAVTGTWLVAPARTPAAVIDRLSTAVQSAMADISFVKELEDLGNDVVTNTTPALALTFMRAEIARWSPIIKKAGIQAES